MDFQYLKSLIPRKTIYWTLDDIQTWLRFIRLPTLIPNFRKHNIEGSDLLSLTQIDILTRLQVDSRIICKKLINWIHNGFPQFDSIIDETNSNQNVESEVNISLSNESQHLSLTSSIQIESSQNLKKTIKYKQSKILILKKFDSHTQKGYYKINETDNRIGTSQSAQIIVKGQNILPFHAYISYRNKNYYLKHVSSQAQLFLRIDKKALIHNGIQIEMGSNILLIGLDRDFIHIFINKGEPNQLQFRYPKNKQKIQIGRKLINDIRFPEDSTLSNLHGKIFLVGQDWFVEDLATTNGTWIKINNEIKIEDGIIFRLGCSISSFQCQIREVRHKEQGQESIVYRKSEDQSCMDCRSNLKNILYLPCKHCILCQKCNEQKLKERKYCQICNSNIINTIKIYKA